MNKLFKFLIGRYLLIILIISLLLLTGCKQNTITSEKEYKNSEELKQCEEYQYLLRGECVNYEWYDEGITELIDKNPPKIFLDNFRTYSMAFVILTDSEHNSVSDNMLSAINGAKQKFSENFKRMTYNRINIDTSDNIYIINLGQLSPSAKDDSSITTINQNIDKMLDSSFDKLNSYEYVSVFHTWPGGEEVDFHEVRHNKASKLRGINYFGSINRLEENNDENGVIDTITLALLHETSHEWGAYEGEELGILNQMGIHYDGKVVAVDPLGGAPWFIKKNGEIDNGYIFASLFKSEGREFLDLTLFVMGVIPQSEVDPILIINEDGTTKKVTIQEIIGKSVKRKLSLDGTAPTDSDGDGMLDWQENQGVNGKYTDHLRSDAVEDYSSPTDECIDSDKGITIDIRGVARYQEAYKDVCILKDSPTEITSVTECSGTNCYIKEYYCVSKTSNPVSKDISCSGDGFNSCMDGACQG